MSFFRNLDPRKIDLSNIEWNRNTAIKLGAVIVAIVVLLWIVQTVIGFVLSIAPWVILALAAYFGYRILSSRDEEVVVEKQKLDQEKAAKKEKTVAEQKYDEVVDRIRVEDQVAEEQPVLAVEETPAETSDEFVDGDDVIARLAEKEQKTRGITDDVLAQIEERRRRLQDQG